MPAAPNELAVVRRPIVTIKFFNFMDLEELDAWVCRKSEAVWHPACS
jgi:hypothetical protein